MEKEEGVIINEPVVANGKHKRAAKKVRKAGKDVSTGKRAAEQKKDVKPPAPKKPIFFGNKTEKKAQYREYKAKNDPYFPLQTEIIRHWETMRSRHTNQEEKDKCVMEIDKMCLEFKPEGASQTKDAAWQMMRRPITSRVMSECIKLGFREPKSLSKANTVSCVLIPNVLKSLLIHLSEAIVDRYAYHIVEELIFRLNKHAFPRYVALPKRVEEKKMELYEYLETYKPEAEETPSVPVQEEVKPQTKKALKLKKKEERKSNCKRPCDFLLLQLAACICPHIFTLYKHNYGFRVVEALYRKAPLIDVLCRQDKGQDIKDNAPELPEGSAYYSFSIKQKFLLQAIIKYPDLTPIIVPVAERNEGKKEKKERKMFSAEEKQQLEASLAFNGSIESMFTSTFKKAPPQECIDNKLESIYNVFNTYLKYHPEVQIEKKSKKQATTSDELVKEQLMRKENTKTIDTLSLILSGMEVKLYQATDFDDTDITVALPGHDAPAEEEHAEVPEIEGAPTVTGESGKLARSQRKALQFLLSQLFQNVLAGVTIMVINRMMNLELEAKDTPKSTKQGNVFEEMKSVDTEAQERDKERVKKCSQCAEFVKILLDPFIKNQQMITNLLGENGGVVFLATVLGLDQDMIPSVLEKPADDTDEKASLKNAIGTSINKFRLKVLKLLTASLDGTVGATEGGACILGQIIEKCRPYPKLLRGITIQHYPPAALILPPLFATADQRRLGRAGITQKGAPLWLKNAIGSSGCFIVLEMMAPESHIWTDWICGKTIGSLRAATRIAMPGTRSEGAKQRAEQSAKMVAQCIMNTAQTEILADKEGQGHPLFKLVMDVAGAVGK